MSSCFGQISTLTQGNFYGDAAMFTMLSEWLQDPLRWPIPYNNKSYIALARNFWENVKRRNSKAIFVDLTDPNL